MDFEAGTQSGTLDVDSVTSSTDFAIDFGGCVGFEVAPMVNILFLQTKRKPSGFLFLFLPACLTYSGRTKHIIRNLQMLI